MKFSIKFLAALIVIAALATNAGILYVKSNSAIEQRLEVEEQNKKIRVESAASKAAMPIMESALAGEQRLFDLSSAAYKASKDLPFKLYPLVIKDETKVTLLKVPLPNDGDTSYLAYKLFIPKGAMSQVRLAIQNPGIVLSDGGEIAVPLEPGHHEFKVVINYRSRRILNLEVDGKKEFETMFLKQLNGYSSTRLLDGSNEFTPEKNEKVFDFQFSAGNRSTPCKVALFIEAAKKSE